MSDPGFDAAIPVRQHAFLESPDGRVAVLVPKFTSPLARKLLVPLLAKPDIRMQLDELGSRIWKACDGHTTVAALTDAVHGQVGGDAGDVRQRVHLFLRQLVREGSLSFLIKEHD